MQTVDGAPPSVIPSSGSDFLMRLLDRSIRNGGGPGNLCHLMLVVEGSLDEVEFRAVVESDPLVRWLAGARLVRPFPWGAPEWRSNPNAIPYIRSATLFGPSEFPEHLLPAELPTPIQFILLAPADRSRTVLVMSWRHELLDAHGAELLLRRIGGSEEPIRTYVQAAPRRRAEEAAPSVARVISSRGSNAWRPTESPGVPRYTVREFSRDAVDAAVRRHGAEFFRSTFLLAAAGEALFAALPKASRLLVGVPHDGRRKGALGPIVGNHLSLLFLGLDRDVSRDSRVAALREQMAEHVRGEFGKRFATFFDTVRLLPERAALALIRRPFGPGLASCFFSYTGMSLLGGSFLGRAVPASRHYPPHLDPPGLTVVMGESSRTLTVTLVSNRRLLSEEDCDRFFERLGIELEDRHETHAAV